MRVDIVGIRPCFPKGRGAIFEHIAPPGKITPVDDVVCHTVAVIFAQDIKGHFCAEYAGFQMALATADRVEQHLKRLFLSSGTKSYHIVSGPTSADGKIVSFPSTDQDIPRNLIRRGMMPDRLSCGFGYLPKAD